MFGLRGVETKDRFSDQWYETDFVLLTEARNFIRFVVVCVPLELMNTIKDKCRSDQIFLKFKSFDRKKKTKLTKNNSCQILKFKLQRNKGKTV